MEPFGVLLCDVMLALRLRLWPMDDDAAAAAAQPLACMARLMRLLYVLHHSITVTKYYIRS